jgi:Putative transposase
MLFLDGVYVVDGTGQPAFRQVAAPGLSELQVLVEQIASRIGCVLERRGLVERDMENAWLASTGEAGPLDDLIGHSITYRIAVGPRAGQKLFTLQTVSPRLQGLEGEPNGAARAGRFSLHAGLDIAPHERPKLERLCRYVSRPPVATERLALTASGHVRYGLKTPYRDGTTHIVLEPLDFMARLAALVPPPKLHLTRYHGVFAPHSKLRAAITPAHRGAGAAMPPATAGESARPPTLRHVAMNWARRLKRVFGIDIESCARCGGKLKIIASIEEPAVIAKILAHLEKTAPDPHQAELPLGARAPPTQANLL